MTEAQDPSPAEVNGRAPDGKFAKGNRAGRGNPHAKRAQRLRTALLSACKPADIRAVVEALITKAKSGDVPSAKLLLDRCLGKTTLPDAPEKPADDAGEPSDTDHVDAAGERSPLLDDPQVADTCIRLVMEFEETLLAAQERFTQQQKQERADQ